MSRPQPTRGVIASPTMCESPDTLLQVRDLRVEFVTDAGIAAVVDGVSLDIPRGRTVALLGESGSGKTSVALSVVRLLPPGGRVTGGRVAFRPDGDEAATDLLTTPERRMVAVRGRHIAMIFQEPGVSLDPVMTAGAQIVEAIHAHEPVRGKAARRRAVDLLAEVGIPDPGPCARAYPHQLSGGMQQRVMIAMALACRPSLVIADEPTAALDAATQTQMLDLLARLQADTGMSMLLISHDLAVAGRAADQVHVMYGGRIIERGPPGAVLAHPAHPYTQALLAAVPRPDATPGRLPAIEGEVPGPLMYPSGCRFHPRCPVAERLAGETDRNTTVVARGDRPVTTLAACTRGRQNEREPALRAVGPGHEVACWEARGAVPDCPSVKGGRG